MTVKQENERLARVEEKTDGIAKDVEEMKGELRDFIKTADTRYAPAWVGKLILSALTIVMTTVLVAILALVVVKPTPITTTVTPTQTKVELPVN
jgi:hypothetical protein